MEMWAGIIGGLGSIFSMARNLKIYNKDEFLRSQNIWQSCGSGLHCIVYLNNVAR